MGLLEVLYQSVRVEGAHGVNGAGVDGGPAEAGPPGVGDGGGDPLEAGVELDPGQVFGVEGRRDLRLEAQLGWVASAPLGVSLDGGDGLDVGLGVASPAFSECARAVARLLPAGALPGVGAFGYPAKVDSGVKVRRNRQTVRLLAAIRQCRAIRAPES